MTTTWATSETKPRTKQGVLLLSRPSSTYVGRMDTGIEIFTPSRTALEYMNGNLNCQQISEEKKIPLEEVLTLVDLLGSAQLLDTEIGKIYVHSRFHSTNINRPSHSSDDSNDGAHRQLQIKLLPELSFSTWQEGVRDGGVALIAARRLASIEIIGSSRIALLLYGILLASGFSQTTISIKDLRTVSDTDISAGFLRSSDIGLSLAPRLAEVSKALSLFPNFQESEPIKKEIPSESKFAVAIGKVPAEQIQEWMSAGVSHLIIDEPDGPSLTIGPLVIPGSTPCLRCAFLSKEENHEVWRDIAWQKLSESKDEVPVAVAHHVAGLLALEILRFKDEGRSELIGATRRIDYRNPLSGEEKLLARHPACGCNW